MRKIFLSMSALILLSTSAATAKPLITGQEAQYRVRELSVGMPWYQNLPQALAESNKTGKLVVWIHMLGKIDGAT
ncbi:MAG: hypothetical protein IAF58_18300 [Leptolyngbya sp.]|nr:hypothetical protein [Candidatus Melainabacteria bacterium]